MSCTASSILKIPSWNSHHDRKLLRPKYKPVTDCQVTACMIEAPWTHGAQRWISAEQSCSGPQQSASLFSQLMSSTVFVRLIREQPDPALQAHSHTSRWPVVERGREKERGRKGMRKEGGWVCIKHAVKISWPSLLDEAATVDKQRPEAEHPDSLPCTN